MTKGFIKKNLKRKIQMFLQ